MRRVWISLEPQPDFMYQVRISVEDEGGEESADPSLQEFAWPARDVIGRERPWLSVLRDVIGLLP